MKTIAVFILLFLLPVVIALILPLPASLGPTEAHAVEDNNPFECGNCGWDPLCHTYCFVEHFFECGLDPDCWDEY